MFANGSRRLSLCADRLSQSTFDSLVAVVLHQRDDGIAEPAKFSRLATVAASVVGDLLAPPPTVALGFGVAARAAVPETSVHEDGDVVVGQHEVGPARQPAGPGGVANFESSGDGAHPTLGRGSLHCHAPHAL